MMWAHVWISVYQKEMQAVNNQKNKTRKPHTSRQKHPLDFLKRNHRKLLEIQVSLVQILFSYDTFIRHCHFDLGNPLFRCLDDLAVRGNHSWLSLMHCFKKPSPKAAMGSRRVGHDWATELNWTEVPWNNPLPCGVMWGMVPRSAVSLPSVLCWVWPPGHVHHSHLQKEAGQVSAAVACLYLYSVAFDGSSWPQVLTFRRHFLMES